MAPKTLKTFESISLRASITNGFRNTIILTMFNKLCVCFRWESTSGLIFEKHILDISHLYHIVIESSPPDLFLLLTWQHTEFMLLFHLHTRCWCHTLERKPHKSNRFKRDSWRVELWDEWMWCAIIFQLCCVVAESSISTEESRDHLMILSLLIMKFPRITDQFSPPLRYT